jgi:lipoprotein-anchoring transpeptidase ErfK/SrfK
MSSKAVRNRRIWLPPAMLLGIALSAAALQAVPPRSLAAAAPIAALAAPSPASARTVAAVPAAKAAPAQSLMPDPRALAGGARTPVASRGSSLVSFPVLAELSIPRWLHPGEFAWNDENVPAAGETVVVVNLRGRVLSVYKAGYEIGRSSITWGTDEKPTPTGEFRILQKRARHFSRTYNNAPMPHMQRLTNDGVALHGAEMADDVATHGCVGLPHEFAALLFGATKVGDRVLILKG